jgi:hypothetical protein
MGISQVPSVPVPTAKGDIVVGTATGPTRLPASTIANQTLIVDSTTTTGLKYGSTARSWTFTSPIYTNPTSGAATPADGSPQTKVIFGGGIYAYATGRYVYYSTDKINWTAQLFSGGATSAYSIATNGTIWVIAAEAQLWSGTPGGTWTSRTTNLDGSTGTRNVFWQPSYNLFILTGGGNASPWNCVSTSPDGITWTKRFNIGASMTTNNFAFNTTGMTVLCTGNATQNILYSTNGTSWTSVDGNAGTSLSSVGIVWLPTAGRFAVMGGNRYSQTPAGIATSWSTNPVTRYNTFDTYFIQNNTTANFPEYDSARGVWYFLMSNFTSVGGSGTGAVGASFLATISDTQLARNYFDANSNAWIHKINSIEPTPMGTFVSPGATQSVLSLANNTLFFVSNTGYQHIIHYSDL